MKTSEKLIAGVGGVVLAVAATFSGIAIANPAGPVDESPAKIVQEQPKTVDLEPEVTPEPTQEPIAPAPAPAPVVEAPAPPPPPAPAPVVKCPAGTQANAVDGAGNESNCVPLNQSGEQCVAFDASNNCTAWMKLG